MLTLFLFISTFSPKTDSLLNEAINYSYLEDFAPAESILTVVKKREVGHPVSYFLLSSLYEMMWVDFGDNSYKDKIFIYADSAIDRAKEWTKKNPDDPWGYFFVGGSYTLKIFYYVMKEDYLGTFFMINPAIYYLEKARDIDSTLADVYLGLGGWEYMKGHLPFMGNDKEKGLAMIRKAIKDAKFVSLYSTLAYANICIREGDYDEAISFLEPLLITFPNSRTFTWPLLKAYYEKKEYRKSLKIVDKLITISSGNDYSKFEAYCYKAKILLELQMLEDALLAVEIALNIELEEDILHVKDIKEELLQIECEIKERTKEEQTAGKEVLTD
jgi:tetratricopeptide (TPR) repeat protein